MTGAEFHPALTDMGLCQVYNGQSMLATFRKTERVDELGQALDSRSGDLLKPERIVGTGTLYEKHFWLNIADRSAVIFCRNYISFSTGP